jgi:hypothetical protein
MEKNSAMNGPKFTQAIFIFNSVSKALNKIKKVQQIHNFQKIFTEFARGMLIKQIHEGLVQSDVT